MKLLVLCPTLDMEKPFSATPYIRQLLKGFKEQNCDVLVIPYAGKSSSSEWWNCYENPNYGKSEFLQKILKFTQHKNGKKNLPAIPLFAKLFAKPKIEKLIKKIILEHDDIMAILIIALPLNQITGLATNVKKFFNKPIIYYDVDLPTSLPENGGFTFNYYTGADLTEYDSFLITSEGSSKRIKELGALSVEPVHFAIDPEICSPIDTPKDIDVFFFGHGGSTRRKNISMMISEPSKLLPYNFVMGGRDYNFDLGRVNYAMSEINYSKWREFSCRSKINLNVVHGLHAETYATSTVRPFELASMGCCVVSSPYSGLENWFDLKKEMLVASNTKECVEIYENLIENEELRLKIGNAAKLRIKKEHTVQHRAKQILQIIKKHE